MTKNDKTKDWIKKIDFTECILFDDYIRKSKFIHVANILKDDVKTLTGNKKRNTLILFDPVITKEEWNASEEYIYIFTINNFIVKIGGTRTGLKSRAGSYLCGHHTVSRGKSGSCSNTNAYIYNTFVFYLEENLDIKMYAYKIPIISIKIDVFDEYTDVSPQTFHIFETVILTQYKTLYKKYPQLSDNCDPKYKK